MAKKVILYCTQHPTKGKAFDKEHANNLLSMVNSGWYSEPLNKKSDVNISRGNKKKDKGAEE